VRLAARTSLLALLLLALVAPFHGSPAGAGTEIDDYIRRINDLRASVGAPKLTVDSSLAGTAQGWANHLASTHQLAHDPHLGAGVAGWRRIGENVGYGPGSDSVWGAFIASGSHYANLVDPGYTHVGVGVAWDGSMQYTVHRFMRVEGAPAPPPNGVTVPPPPPPPAPPATHAPAPPPTTAPRPAPTTVPAPVVTTPPPGSVRQTIKSLPPAPPRAGAMLTALAQLTA
jgi:hypothetical protein